MALKVRLTARAIADLDEIRAYLLTRSPKGAERPVVEEDFAGHKTRAA